MADWPMMRNLAQSAHYPTGSGIDNVRLAVTGGAAHTKGSWAEIVSSAPFDVSAIMIFLNLGFYLEIVEYLFDIGVGASGSEQVVIANLLFSSTDSVDSGSSRNNASCYLLPTAIPAGSRISIRTQESVGSKAFYTGIQLFGGSSFLSPPSAIKVDTYGANTAVTAGVEIDPGGTALTKGSYSEITPSCEDIKGLIIAISNKSNGSRADSWFGLDIAIGSSGSEQVIIPNYTLYAYSNTDSITPSLSPTLPIHIPAGTRIAARAMCQITDATDRLFGIILYGLR